MRFMCTPTFHYEIFLCFSAFQIFYNSNDNHAKCKPPKVLHTNIQVFCRSSPRLFRGIVTQNFLHTSSMSYTGRKLENLQQPVPNDIEISQSVEPLRVTDLAKNVGILENELLPYGDTKAKVKLNILERLKNQQNGKVSGMNQFLIINSTLS
jgi:hypothetical protein